MTQTRRLPVFLTIAVIILLGFVSWSIQYRITKESQAELGETLNTVLETTHQAVKSWIKEHKARVSFWANSPEVRRDAATLLAIPHDQATLLASVAQARLRSWFHPLRQATGYQGYFIIAPDNISLASSRDQNVGIKNLLVDQEHFMQRVWSGETAVSLPLKSDVPLPDENGRLREGLPTMFVGAPIKDESGKVLAVFTFRINPAADFASIFRQGRIGESGETYSFDKQGLMISDSRFNHQLRRIGVISHSEEAILNVRIKDPGVDLLKEKSTVLPKESYSLTLMARNAVTGQTGLHVEGYRGYRGAAVVGAWLWDEELDFGIATELELAEAYQTLRTTRYTIFILTLMLILLLGGAITLYVVYRQRKKSEKKTLELLEQNRQLTQRLFQIQEDERRHLARELHDEFGQWLTALRMHTHVIEEACNNFGLDTQDSVKKINNISSQMQQGIRRMIYELKPLELDELGLRDSLQELVDQWRTHFPQIHCELNMEGCLNGFNDTLNVTIYRVIQESLTNVAKYAEAGNVSILLHRLATGKQEPDRVLLSIEDDGKGMSLGQPVKGYGIAGMRERVLAAGGGFKLHSSLGEGVQIEVQLPVTSQLKV